jgi:hypothetical protein
VASTAMAMLNRRHGSLLACAVRFLTTSFTCLWQHQQHTISSSVQAGEESQVKPMTLKAAPSMSPSRPATLLLALYQPKKRGLCQWVRPGGFGGRRGPTGGGVYDWEVGLGKREMCLVAWLTAWCGVGQLQGVTGRATSTSVMVHIQSGHGAGHGRHIRGPGALLQVLGDGTRHWRHIESDSEARAGSVCCAQAHHGVAVVAAAARPGTWKHSRHQAMTHLE